MTQRFACAVAISAAAWNTIRGEVAAADGDELETGGILLGHDHGETVSITVAGNPGPNAIRTRDRFHRDRDHAQRLANHAWDANRAQWVGEWHTHPGSTPAPSEIDLTSYATHLADDELSFARFISIIVGTSPTRQPTRQTVVATWVITPSEATLVPLRVHREGPL